MGVEQSLRDLQDSRRNAGWRIQWIPWQAAGKVEWIYNTPLTKLTGCGGMLLFLASLGSVATHSVRVEVGLACAGAAFATMILGRFYAAWHKYRRWISIRATCLDQETGSATDSEGDPIWLFRVLCSFEYQGRDYTVTPQPVTSFKSEERVRAYLARCIDADKRCTIWVNPDNPLQTNFEKCPRI